MTIGELRNKIILQNDFTSFLGDPKNFADLDASQQIKVTNDMDNFIINNPGQFTPEQVVTAQRVTGQGGISGTTDYGLSQATSDFTTEVANQAVAINNDLNPFSEKNRGTVFVVALIGVFLYILGPKLIEEFFKSKGGKTPSAPKPPVLPS